MTTAPTNLATLPIDRLKRLAKEGPDAATRAAAARALEARSSAAQPSELRASVEVITTEYGTPQPELQLALAASANARELRALLYELAGQAERTLSRTPELWVVTVRHDSEHNGAIVLELLDGTAAESERACALLHTLVQAKPARKRGRPRGTRAHSSTPVPAKKQETKRAAAAVVA